MALTLQTVGGISLQVDSLSSGYGEVLKVGFGAAGSDATLVTASAIANGLPLQAIDGAIVTLGAKADAKAANTDTTAITLMQVAKQLSDYLKAVSRGIVVTASAVTRPANVTAYSINDAISNNATAASVTPVTFAFSDTNDAPIDLERMRIATTDTGLAAGVGIVAWMYSSDPTASTGVVGGDNAAFSTKQGNFIGKMVGNFTAFSDGGVAELVPLVGSRIRTKPNSGGSNVYCLFQVTTAFTPSANSTTLTPTLEGSQVRP